MNRIAHFFTIVAAIVVLPFAFAQSEDEYLATARDVIACAEKINALLNSVKDQDSANRIAPDVKKLATEYAGLNGKISKMDPPSSSSKMIEYVELKEKMVSQVQAFAMARSRLAQNKRNTVELEKALSVLWTNAEKIGETDS